MPSQSSFQDKLFWGIWRCVWHKAANTFCARHIPGSQGRPWSLCNRCSCIGPRGMVDG